MTECGKLWQPPAMICGEMLQHVAKMSRNVAKCDNNVAKCGNVWQDLAAEVKPLGHFTPFVILGLGK